MIMASTLFTDWGGRRWELRSERVLVDHDARTVVAADLHLGKSDHFRAAGVPVPEQTNADTLDRLATVCEATAAESLIVLGDFFHSRDGVTPGLVEKLQAWRERTAWLDVFNVRGNHDRRAGDPPKSLDIEVWDKPVRDGELVYAHEPEEREDAFVLCGHLHPAVKLSNGQSRRGDRMRLPCFVLGERYAVLPAFGAFTGAKCVSPKKGQRIYVVGPGRVADVSKAVVPA
ncbi:MAG: ligase-associated DNA damage response endonuclease PdeM [Planctomycetota bacterium]